MTGPRIEYTVKIECMIFAFSICVAILISLALFYKQIRTTDQSPIIFLLSLTLLVILCSSAGISSLPFNGGPGTLFLIGGVLLMLFGGTDTFKVLVKMPTSAFKAIAPVAICVGIILLLGLVVVL